MACHRREGTEAGLAQLLAALRTAGNQPVSGERLALAAGISRAAVWKRINRLKAWGYEIVGEPRQGYRLLSVPDKLLPAEILHGLTTRRLRGPIHYFDALASTNDLAKELGANGAPEGTLVAAEAQSKGRGRLGRSWESPPAVGLYVSLLLRPPLPPGELPQITLTTAVAGVRAIKRGTGLTVGIKWPNDLLVAGKKAGGILTEMETESDRIRYLVVGWGLNVNNPGFPPELAPVATSLFLATGQTYSRVAILQAWLEEFEDLYERFLAREFPLILREWKQYAVTLGREVQVLQGTRPLRGRAVDVDTDGALLLEQPTGKIVRVTSGEIAPDPNTDPGR
jgi:BirA family biotin operon repressor/biotin-[acetyl-CoA-carboxylase] ligase|uniref:Bifunctional ligase/repressor BirA n=1 Tax=Desulfobacca acetoxidans TaxID=60893 RepID=A0A7C3WS56_9BACT